MHKVPKVARVKNWAIASILVLPFAVGGNCTLRKGNGKQQLARDEKRGKLSEHLYYQVHQFNLF